jgi:hypothetical protein
MAVHGQWDSRRQATVQKQEKLLFAQRAFPSQLFAWFNKSQHKSDDSDDSIFQKNK